MSIIYRLVALFPHFCSYVHSHWPQQCIMYDAKLLNCALRGRSYLSSLVAMVIIHLLLLGRVNELSFHLSPGFSVELSACCSENLLKSWIIACCIINHSVLLQVNCMWACLLKFLCIDLREFKTENAEFDQDKQASRLCRFLELYKQFSQNLIPNVHHKPENHIFWPQNMTANSTKK